MKRLFYETGKWLTVMAALTALSVIFAFVPQFSGLVTEKASAEELPASGTCGSGCTYTFDPETGLLTISGDGYIDSYAFSDHDEIKKAVIGKGIQLQFRCSVFENCDGLEEVVFSGRNYRICAYCFCNCTSLKKVSLCEDTTIIENCAFKGCKNLKDMALPESVTYIGAEAFSNCSSWENVSIPPKTGSIGSYAYVKCNKLGYAVLPQTIESLGENIFDNCTGLKKIRIETEGWNNNGREDDIFGEASFVEKLEYSAKTRQAADCRGLWRLKEITAESSNPYLTSVNGVLYSKDKTELITWPAHHEGKIPSHVKTIRSAAFYNKDNVKDPILLVIPETVKKIESKAFVTFTSRDYVVLGHDTEIAEDSFEVNDLCHVYVYPDNKKNQQSRCRYITSTQVVNLSEKMLMPGMNDYYYSSTNEALVTIMSNGIITRKGAGTAEVYAFGDGKAERYVVIAGYTDVPKNSYYYDAVYWATDEGITGGVKNPSTGLYDRFCPQNTCTRGQMVTFLWRMAGCPEPKSDQTTFTDLDKKAYYYKAVLWGTEKGIIGGYSDHTFRPENECTRKQAVTFLWRYYGKPEPMSMNSSFKDVKDKNAYYYKAVLWASEKGITGGYSDGTFQPENVCSRAQMVSFLYRCRKN